MSCTHCECPFYALQSDEDLFAALDMNCLVTDAVKQINFAAGDVLFAQGQPSSSLYSLSSGVVKITSNSSDGREQIVGLSRPGKLVVGLQSMGQERYGYSAVAATDGSACKIRHRALLRALEDRVDIALRLITALNAQLAQSRSLMEVMGQKNASAKIASFILLLAPAKTGASKRINGSNGNNGNNGSNGNAQFNLPLSRNDMAGLLGLSEETVCRQMAEMKRQGVIHAPRGTLQIRNWDRLHAIANR